MSLAIARVHPVDFINVKMLQLLGDLVPQTSYRGFAPRVHWGIPSYRPSTFDPRANI